MRALIIEDEKQARDLLRQLLEAYAPSISSIDEAPKLLEGIEKIKGFSPDIVFLDIEMPDHLGTQITEFLDPAEFNFHLVFTTAYSDYAIKAFEMNAVDYLLKPIRPDQIKKTIERIKKLDNKKPKPEQINALGNSLKGRPLKKLAIPIHDGLRFIEFERIMHLEADGMYTNFSVEGEDNVIASKPLKHFIGLLDPLGYFFRCHRSHYVNMNYIKQFVRRDGNYLILENDIQVPVSRDNKEKILELISGT